MTGIEALSLLKDGKLLRRTSWESHEKCQRNIGNKLFLFYDSR